MESIFISIKNHDWEKVDEYISDKRSNLIITDNYGNSLILYLVMFNKPELLKKCIGRNIKLDNVDEYGRSILFIPIKYNYSDIFDILIILNNKDSIGESIFTIQDNSGKTAIHYAIEYKNNYFIKEILKQNINLNLKTNNGFNSLAYAIKHKIDNDIIKDIIDTNNVKLYSLNIYGITPLQLTIIYDNYDILCYILRRDNTGINIKDFEYQFSALHYAVKYNKKKHFIKLLDNDLIDLNSQDFQGNSIIHHIILENNHDFFDILIKKNINVNIWNLEHKFPLHLALELSFNHFYPFLIDNTNLNYPDIQKRSCLYYIVKKNIWKKYKEILEHKQLDVLLERIIDLVNKEDYDEFMDLIVNSYNNHLTNKSVKWRNDWENTCVNCKDKIREELTKLFNNENSSITLSFPLKLKPYEIRMNYGPDIQYCSFTGEIIDILFGLIYLTKKHSNVCSYISNKIGKCMVAPNTDYLYDKNCDYFNFEILWSYKDLIIKPKVIDSITNCIENQSFNFVIIPLGIELPKGSHANYIIIDKEKKEIERFEPHGYDSPYQYDYDDVLLDSLLKIKFNEIIPGFSYFKPKDYLPKIGFQQIESNEPLMNISDPKGFCALWVIWYVDMRMTYHTIPRERLVIKLIEYVRRENIYFKNLIRNYSKQITSIRDDIFDLAGININKWISNDYTYDNIKIINDEIYKLIKEQQLK